MSASQMEFDMQIKRTKEEEEKSWDARIEKNCRAARLMFHLAKKMMDDIEKINQKKE